jgi:hypothetical protein
MKMSSYAEPALWRENPPPHNATRSSGPKRRSNERAAFAPISKQPGAIQCPQR